MLIAILLSYYPVTRLSALLLTAILVANFSAIQYKQNLEKISVLPKYNIIIGKINNIYRLNDQDKPIIFVVDQLNDTILTENNKLILKLYWKQRPILADGQYWKLVVKLTQRRGLNNGVGFDREMLFLSQQINGSGTVYQGTLISSEMSVRQKLFSDIVLKTDQLSHQSFLLALSFGYRQLISDKQWQSLKESGTIHLIAISGLHIGFAMFIGLMIAHFIIRVVKPKAELIYYQWLLSILFGFVYCWLAGFSIPAVRALIMATLTLILWNNRAKAKGRMILLSTFTLLLVAEPLNQFSAGFWLSFGAVGILIFSQYWRTFQVSYQSRYHQVIGVQPRDDGFPAPIIRSIMIKLFDLHKEGIRYLFGKIILLLKVQLLLLICMLPLQLIFFSGFAPLSPLFNLIIVPWLTLITVPLILLSLLTHFFPLSDYLWIIANYSLYPVVKLISLSEGWWFEVFDMTIKSNIILSLLLLLFSVVVGVLAKKWISILIMLLTFVFIYYRSNQEQPIWQVTILDVGHGLAVVIEKNHRVIVYDTGNIWPGGSIAQSVIKPFLKRQGIKNIDGIIISHGDGDHAGGLPFLLDNYKPTWVRQSQFDPDSMVGISLPCKSGEAWEWQGLRFKAYWPPKLSERADNNHSCVIQVSDGQFKLLLTGDIEQLAEFLLLQNDIDIMSDIVVAPHHGSQSSSSQKWVRRINAKLVLNSIAKGNQWNLPSQDVVDRYRRQGAFWLGTDEVGAINIQFYHDDWRYFNQKNHKQPYWYRHLVGDISGSE
ncbi:DNA internalization-related competence protein ComEC/Rec2 [Vibrio sp. SS-MA-C1-2]|uniref:DNA internalization-related competence protein ComEC/Rec2 n=1 Tax=Vibrio sp. SS-MA-C1-2 TaxID=2908646 RepID=UPI001F3CAE5F|nr:DNA internalization-related competence protein ComEC/Rec2 [Vibrio sp. SS-MA-C1-2]UJF17390.1 DNA internalization-related competence protein ComEC/Rec2 [Vibrio sp. SS-MA-C1-2]